MQRLIKGKAYKVSWYDILNNNSWMSFDDILQDIKRPPQKHVWYFVGYEGDWRIFSSGQLNENGEYPDYYALPKGVIYKLTQIR